MSVQVQGAVRRRRLTTEAVTVGLAFAAVLGWGSTALVGSFRGQDLAEHYWQPIPLRTDTSGFIAFLVAAICLATSEYLRLRRRREAVPSRPADPRATMALAVAETVAVLATGLFVYLSFNAITHPETLLLHVTHLLPWPAEGTVRVEALLLCGCSVAVWRYLRARYSWAPGPAGPAPGRDQAALARRPWTRTRCPPGPGPCPRRVESATVSTEVLPDSGTREDTTTTPDIRPGDGDHERFAHYVERDKIVDSAVSGTPVIALCGKVWVPSRDPKRFPVCPDCKRIYEGLPKGDD